jgi:hypothetical protein
MLSIFREFSQYMPHGMCLLWDPWVLTLWAGADILIVLAYFATPFALFRVLLMPKDIKQCGLIILFASFILLCGVTHGLSVFTIWVPIYPLQGMIKLMAGLVSATTAVVFFQACADANRNLRAQVIAHKETLSALRRAWDNLELKVAERTDELKEENTKLSITAREAIHRSHNLISVVTSMARKPSRTQTDITEFTYALIWSA